MAERRLAGTPAAPGIAIGKIVRRVPARIATRRESISADQIPAELARLKRAIEQARQRIEQAREAALRAAGPEEASIFDSHLLMLEDPAFIGEALRRIRDQRLPAEPALEETTAILRRQFETIEDSYLRERAADVDDVSIQILRVLNEPGADPLAAAPASAIVVTNELLLSDTALFDPTRVVGLVTERGTRTAHTAILARALGIPMVVGIADALAQTTDGQQVVVDGDAGELVLEPTPATLAGLEVRLVAQEAERQRWRRLRHAPARTLDGTRVLLLANVSELEEVELALANGAEGVGLLRSEFLFHDRPSLPSEEEQYAAYRHVLELMGPERPVAIRTLDPDRDKPVPGIVFPKHDAVSGLRGIRLARQYPAVFRTQLRALLRAATAGNLRILLPMVATIDDVRFARASIETAAAELASQAVVHRADIPVGIMIEIPAAAIMADLLIQEADFFSIGTNDLIQYTLAVDRSDPQLATLYDSQDVAVLRLLRMATEAAQAADKPISVCGELAGEPDAVPTLIGMGIRQLSMSPMCIPRIKEKIGRLDSHAVAVATRLRLAGQSPP